MTTPLAYTIPDVVAVLRQSRAVVYREIKAGRLRSFTVGGRRYVSADAAREYVVARETEAAATRKAESAKQADQRDAG